VKVNKRRRTPAFYPKCSQVAGAGRTPPLDRFFTVRRRWSTGYNVGQMKTATSVKTTSAVLSEIMMMMTPTNSAASKAKLDPALRFRLGGALT